MPVSRARADELATVYQRTIQGAFQEVADVLVARRCLDEQIVAQERTVVAQLRLARTARQRYDNGIAIYLEVLDAERNLFAAQQQLLQLRATVLQNSISLYVALGGRLAGKMGGAPFLLDLSTDAPSPDDQSGVALNDLHLTLGDIL
ncbi:MAG: TolC family protein [Sphingobium sp.]